MQVCVPQHFVQLNDRFALSIVSQLKRSEVACDADIDSSRKADHATQC